eukprot:TRINITY_DN11766_c0_g1_i15.p1 TRINITY_DN11766_c0_g1~~TRINITY_DN11766_c0_g1_i15.p1  ORF type:complete len:224 (+),score=-17.94 TRINITY_DN11766_c0_g1_i15:360-1031(+)
MNLLSFVEKLSGMMRGLNLISMRYSKCGLLISQFKYYQSLQKSTKKRKAKLIKYLCTKIIIQFAIFYSSFYYGTFMFTSLHFTIFTCHYQRFQKGLNIIELIWRLHKQFIHKKMNYQEKVSDCVYIAVGIIILIGIDFFESRQISKLLSNQLQICKFNQQNELGSMQCIIQLQVQEANQYWGGIYQKMYASEASGLFLRNRPKVQYYRQLQCIDNLNYNNQIS